MGNTLILRSPIPVSVNHYIKPRPVVRNINGKQVVQSAIYETKQAKDYKAAFKKYIINEVKLQNYTLQPNKTQHFYIDCVFYFKTKGCDANNYFKLLLDAITETRLIWLDDDVCCERVQGIYFDSHDPHIDIIIHPVDYVGIFPSIEHLNEFKKMCMTCSRYTHNCSLLRKAEEGRIQEEIKDYCCEKYKKQRSMVQNEENRKNVCRENIIQKNG